MMGWIIAIIGLSIGCVSMIALHIGSYFNPFYTTPFSKYTFAKFCYEFDGFLEVCMFSGFATFIGVCIGKFI